MKNTSRKTTSQREWTLGRNKRRSVARAKSTHPTATARTPSAAKNKKQLKVPNAQHASADNSIFVRKPVTVTKIKRRYTLKKRLALWRAKITEFKLPKLKKFSYYRANWGVKQKPVAWVGASVAIFASFGMFLAQGPSGNVLSASTTDTLYVNGDNTVTGWGNTTGYTSGVSDSSCAGGTYCDYVDENDNAEYLGTGTDGGADELEFDFPDVTEAASLEQVTHVRANVRTDQISQEGGSTDTLSVRLFIDGAYNGTTQLIFPTATEQTQLVAWPGLSASTASDLRIEIVRNVLGSGNPSNQDDDIRVLQVFVEVTYDYTAPPSELTLEGYVFENVQPEPDLSTVQSNAQASTAVNDSSSGTVAWTNPGNVTDQSSTSATVSLQTNQTSNYLKTTNYGFNIPDNATIVGISTFIDRCSDLGEIVSNHYARLVAGSVVQSTSNEGASFTNTCDANKVTTEFGGSTDLWGDTWTPNDINSVDFGWALQVFSGAISAPTVLVDNAFMTIYYTLPTTTGAQSGSEFSAGKVLSQVRKGESINLRTHLTNNGGPLTEETELGLFYDRNDGIWSKVQNQTPPITGNGTGCASSDWTCKTIENSLGSPIETSVAISPDGQPWVAYDSEPGDNLKVARYVGSGGNGCTGSTTSGEWSCEVVDLSSGTDTGDFAEIAFAPDGSAWIAYNYGSAVLRVAHFVGSGGNCDSLFGGSDAWDCWTVHDTGGVNYYKGITFDATGNPIIAYYDTTSTSLLLTTYVGGASGSGCDSTDWDGCAVIDDDGSPTDMDIVTDGNGKLWIGYAQTANLKVAEYVGSGGSGCATGVTDWHCYLIHNNGNPGAYAVKMDVAPNGKPSIAYFDSLNNDLWYANYVGTGNTGGCDTTAGGTGDDADLWDCTQVIATDDVGRYPDLAFDSAGNAWISYHDFTSGNLDLEYARFVGGGNGSGCASSNWSCEVIDSTGSVGGLTGIAFKPDGNPIISYRDDTNSALKFATIERGGEILISPSQSGAAGDVLSASHADMTSSSDTTNRDDADCLNATAWSNGMYFEAENGTGLSIPDGSTTSQCTEVMWTIDTSQASPGTTYRFVVATNDSFRPDKGAWRGPVAVAADGYPTLTIASEEKSTYRYSKDTTRLIGDVTGLSSGPNDGSSVATRENGINWTQTSNVLSSDDSDASVNVPAEFTGTDYLDVTGLGFSIPSSAVIRGVAVNVESRCTVFNCSMVNGQLRLLKDGTPSGGSRAFTPTTSEQINQLGSTTDLWNDTWTSSDINNANFGVSLYMFNDSVSSPSGSWEVDYVQVIVYYDLSYDCTDTSWTCETVDTENSETATAGMWSSMSIAPDGVPQVVYRDVNDLDLKIASYVGSGGTGCSSGGSSAWNCTAVEDSGAYSSHAIDTSGTTWIGYRSGSSNLRVARFVGSGGTGCLTAEWHCEDVITTADTTGITTSTAIDKTGNPWIAHHNTTSDEIEIAKYVGSGAGTGCTNTDWSCEVVDAGMGSPSIAFTQSGQAVIAMQDPISGHLRVARYVGSGGTGCTSGVTAWTCTTVYSATVVQTGTPANVDENGNPVVVFTDTAGSAWTAEYVGSSGSGCASSAWTCTRVVQDDVDDESTLYSAFDSQGNLWFPYSQGTNDDAWVAHYVGSGGNCDSLGSATGSDAWQCEKIVDVIVDDASYSSHFASLAFDHSGALWMSVFDKGDGTCDSTDECKLIVAKQKTPTAPPSYLNAGTTRNNRNAGSGDMGYRLSSGVSPYGAYGTPCGGVTDYLGYCGLYDNDGQYDSIIAGANERPMYSFATRLGDNTKLPQVTFDFLTDTSPSTNNVVLQAYRFGTTNAWETVATYSSAGCSTNNCRIQTLPSGTPSEYYEADGSEYWIYFRVYQEESTTNPITLKVDNFSAEYPSSFLRNGRSFRELRSDPLGW